MNGCNLLADSWIFVRRRSGAVVAVSPAEALWADAPDPAVELAMPRPDFNGAVSEFLIGLLATCLAAEDEDGWEDLFEQPPGVVDLSAAFAPYKYAFELLGDGPRFLQDFDAELTGSETPVDRLLMDRPGEQTLKNNADLFAKR